MSTGGSPAAGPPIQGHGVDGEIPAPQILRERRAPNSARSRISAPATTRAVRSALQEDIGAPQAPGPGPGPTPGSAGRRPGPGRGCGPPGPVPAPSPPPDTLPGPGPGPVAQRSPGPPGAPATPPVAVRGRHEIFTGSPGTVGVVAKNTSYFSTLSKGPSAAAGSSEDKRGPGTARLPGPLLNNFLLSLTSPPVVGKGESWSFHADQTFTGGRAAVVPGQIPYLSARVAATR